MSKKRRKRVRVREQAEGIAPDSPRTTTDRPEVPPRRSGGFFWGLAAGFLATLALTIASDLGWIPLGEWTQPPATAEIHGTAAPSAEREFLLRGAVPSGGVLVVDGHVVATETEGGWTRIQVPPEAARLEVRSGSGVWWSTPLGPGAADTLRPVWTGEIVVEAEGPARGATLYLDGNPAGSIPGVVENVAPGWHVVSAQAGDVVFHEDACSVGPGEVVSLSVPAPPPRGQARLIVRSRRLEETGVVETLARPVRVDGKPSGQTPLEILVESGHHSISVEEPGRGPRIEVVRLEAGAARYVDIEAAEETPPRLEIGPVTGFGAKGSLVVPVRVVSGGAPLREASLHVARSQQAETVDVPLVASPGDPELWLGSIPKTLQGRGPLRIFASGTDALGRSAWSELATVPR